jgi:RNA polymerase sigma-70 factor (ECF subfamily)
VDSDEALFERLIAGDLRAFDLLYDRFERPLFGFIRSQLRDVADAEDILHETFMSVLRERAARHEVRSFKAWLFQVARNLCLNRIRTQRRAGRALEAAAQVEAVAPPSAAADHALERREQLVLLQRAVERLPAALAEIYRLRAAGMSYDELAEILDVPVGTVKSRIHEVVKRLREEVPR